MADPLPKVLHSRYNPTKEADRFTAALDLPEDSAVLIVCEPGESYLCGPLRSRFKAARLIALRLTSKHFTDSDGLWDAVWRPNSTVPLDSFLINEIPDEVLPLTRYLEWPPAADMWSVEVESVRSSIRVFMDIQKRVILTRFAFGPRWLKNMVDNLIGVHRLLTVSPGESPVFLAGAGPSLERHVDFARTAPFTLAVSSALGIFRHRSYSPQLCIATDGGFWAKRYFRNLPELCAIAAPLEAAVPTDALGNYGMVPLAYGSPLEQAFYSCCGISAIPARRNGTVSGTAAELALGLTKGLVFAAGLDFQASAAFHHARPHFSENDVRARETRFTPAASVFFPQKDKSLEIYAAWFENHAGKFSDRFYRISPSGRPLKGIRDTTPAEALLACQTGLAAPRIAENTYVPARIERAKRLRTYLESLTEECRELSDFHGIERVKKPGALSDFMQLADYRGYLEMIPLISRTDIDRESRKKIADEFSFMEQAARNLIKRLDNRADL